MERIPSGVKVKIVREPLDDKVGNKGISLDVPADLRSNFREEIIAVMTDPDHHSFLRVLVEEYGFVILNLTLLKAHRESMKGVEHLTPSRNYLPLIWHKDGGTKHLAPFSFLFTDTSGPRRLS